MVDQRVVWKAIKTPVTCRYCAAEASYFVDIPAALIVDYSGSGRTSYTLSISSGGDSAEFSATEIMFRTDVGRWNVYVADGFTFVEGLDPIWERVLPQTADSFKAFQGYLDVCESGQDVIVKAKEFLAILHAQAVVEDADVVRFIAAIAQGVT